MKAVTGEAVVLSMMDLALEVNRWNKKNTSKTVLIEKLEELGLTSHQMEILGFMRTNPELDTVSQLATELFISKGSLSLMLSKLKAGGFVQKKSAKGEDDGRKVYVSLTEKGKKAVDSFGEIVVSNAAVAFNNMDDERRTLFYTKVEELKELFNIGGWKE